MLLLKIIIKWYFDIFEISLKKKTYLLMKSFVLISGVDNKNSIK